MRDLADVTATAPIMLSIPGPANGLALGLYGKLPSHGDFLCRRMPDAFLETWDAWLQECVADSRATLGGRWLDLYLTSPVWRFAFAAGVCGPAAVLGLMVKDLSVRRQHACSHEFTKLVGRLRFRSSRRKVSARLVPGSGNFPLLAASPNEPDGHFIARERTGFV